MKIDELLNGALESTRIVKETVLHRDAATINPTIEVWRADVPVAILSLRVENPATIVQYAASCAAGFDADAVSIAFEGLLGAGSTSGERNINPMTGKVWDGTQMHDVAHDHDGIAKGWVKEVIVVHVVNRAGDLSGAVQTFTVSSGSLTWGETLLMSTLNKDWTAEGGLPDAMIKMMLLPSGSIAMPLDEPGGRDQRDAAVAHLLSNDDCAVWLWSHGHDTQRIATIHKDPFAD